MNFADLDTDEAAALLLVDKWLDEQNVEDEPEIWFDTEEEDDFFYDDEE